MITWDGKKLTKKVKNVMKSDFFASLALVSILFNVFFFTGVVLFRSTNQLDMSLHTAAFDNLCNKNYTENLQEELKASNDPRLTQTLFEIRCQEGDFKRYYENAVQAYINDSR